MEISSTKATGFGSNYVCGRCDALLSIPDSVALGQEIYCPNCDATIGSFDQKKVHQTAAYSISGLMAWCMCIVFPFLGFSAQGQERSIYLIQGVYELVGEGGYALMLTVLILAVVLPGMLVSGLVYTSLSLLAGRAFPGVIIVMRVLTKIMPWTMGEIFLVGILVSFIKILSLADITLGESFWAYVIMTLATTFALHHFDKSYFWRRLYEITHE